MSVKLLDKNFHAAEYIRQDFRAIIPVGISKNDIMLPEYWNNVARKVNIFDVIEVVPEDGAFYLRLLVVAVGTTWLTVKELEYKEFQNVPNVTDILANDYEIKWSGPVNKWRVARKSDNKSMVDTAFHTKEDAQEWLNNNSRNLMVA